MNSKVKITVLRREIYRDLVEKYAEDFSQCTLFEDDQEFILEGADKPDNFCSWAWADIQRDVVAVLNGASFKWVNAEHTIISCCTDGFRPVVFKIERIDF